MKYYAMIITALLHISVNAPIYKILPCVKAMLKLVESKEIHLFKKGLKAKCPQIEA
jgi:hypothetical protein